MSVKIQMDISKILAKRHLTGEAQTMFTKNCAKEGNNFTPFRTGRLKDSSVELGKDFIKYNTPYAKKQYYTNKGEGLQGESNGGLRGKFWDKRMWILKGASIIKELAKFIGGHTK